MMQPTCETGVRRLMDYLEGALPSRLRVLLESHVAGCPSCRAFIASYLATPRIIRVATDRAPTAEQQRALLEYLRSHRDSRL